MICLSSHISFRSYALPKDSARTASSFSMFPHGLENHNAATEKSTQVLNVTINIVMQQDPFMS